MKFQQLVLTGLFALATTATAQSAFAQTPNQTHLTSGDVATIAKSRSTVRTPAPSATQTLNLTHLTSDQVSTVQVTRMSQAVQKTDSSSLNPTQFSSDDTAAIGINVPFNTESSKLIEAQPQYPPSPIVDVVVNRQGNHTSHIR